MHVETLLSAGPFARSQEWADLRGELHLAIEKVDWPPGTGKFIIFPQSGKKTGEGNGLGPIKNSLMSQLRKASWNLEEPLDIATVDGVSKWRRRAAEFGGASWLRVSQVTEVVSRQRSHRSEQPG